MSRSKQPAGFAAGKPEKPAAKAVTASKAFALSTEYVDDSESEDESENVDVTATSSSSESLPATRVKEISPAQASKKGTTIPRPFTTETIDNALNQSPSSSASEEESDSSRESGDERVKGVNGEDVAQKQSKKPAQSQPKLPQQQPPYEPPPGFELGSIPLSSSVGAGLLSRSNLEGKQIWHITVPASVPVDSIKEVSMQSFQKGEAALSYKGADYGFVTDGESQNALKKLLIPNHRDNSYRPAAMSVSQTLHLQQLVGLPYTGNGSGGIGNSTQATASPFRAFRKQVRQQPEGLRMRYRPFGDTEGRLGRVGSEFSTSGGSDDEQAQFRVPIGVNSSARTKKRKHNATDGPNDGHQSPEEQRQKRSRSQIDHATGMQGTVEVSPIMTDSQGDKIRKGSIDNRSEAIVANGAGQKPTDEPSEDRAKRKEEKRRRKKERALAGGE